MPITAPPHRPAHPADRRNPSTQQARLQLHRDALRRAAERKAAR